MARDFVCPNCCLFLCPGQVDPVDGFLMRLPFVATVHALSRSKSTLCDARILPSEWSSDITYHLKSDNLPLNGEYTTRASWEFLQFGKPSFLQPFQTEQVYAPPFWNVCPSFGHINFQWTAPSFSRSLRSKCRPFRDSSLQSTSFDITMGRNIIHHPFVNWSKIFGLVAHQISIAIPAVTHEILQCLYDSLIHAFIWRATWIIVL